MIKNKYSLHRCIISEVLVVLQAALTQVHHRLTIQLLIRSAATRVHQLVIGLIVVFVLILVQELLNR